MEDAVLKYAILFFAVLISGCEHERSFHGNYITADDLSKIKIGTTTQRDVRTNIGSPFMVTNKNEWLYISKEEDSLPFKEHIICSHRTYKIEFTPNGIVSNVQTADIQDLKLKFDKQDTRLKK